MNENDGLVLNVEFQREIEKFRAWMLGINFNLREELNTLSQQITKLENAVVVSQFKYQQLAQRERRRRTFKPPQTKKSIPAVRRKGGKSRS
jgi:hypothetical protein